MRVIFIVFVYFESFMKAVVFVVFFFFLCVAAYCFVVESCLFDD